MLCSLLAASTMGIFYSSDALAASVNGETPEDGVTITNEFLTGEANSCKVVVGHGNVSIQTNAIVGEMLKNYQTGGLGAALNPSNDNQNVPVVGVVGGEIKITDNGKAMIGFAGKIVDDVLKTEFFTDDNLAKLYNIQSPENANITQDVTVTIGSTTVNPVVLGSFSSDLLIVGVGDNETLNRTGNVVENINSGNVIGGFGGSGAVSILGGIANTTLTGNIEKTVTGNANIGIHANGGLATTLLGGDTTSTVDGNTSLVIDTTTGEEGAIDALTVGVAGGGAAIGIDGGSKAESTVTGTTNIEVSGNGTAIGLIGGGIAAGMNGLIADLSDGDNVVANASTGKANIVVNLEAKDKDNAATNIGKALSSIISTVKAATDDNQETEPTLNTEELKKAVGQGAAVGVFGGGVAAGIGGNINGGTFNVNATATTDGANISLENGYVAGVFGGGAAIAVNNAKATATNGDVTTHIEEGMKAVGVFGGGFALSAENGAKEDNSDAKLNDTLASSTVNSNNIEIYGDVDGVFGGGMAIGNSNLGRGENISDAVASVGTSNITVNSGTIDNLNIKAIMDATKNDNTDKAPWWSSLGMNASMAMNDLKGITDETSIAAGGLGMGMTGAADVKTANVTINGGTVKKDILGGGIAVDNMRDGSGAHVGISTITLNGGTVEGSVYAGGAINGTTPQEVLTGWPQGVEGHKGYETVATSSTVDEATVILNGATVNGEISGQGYESKTNYNDGGFNPYTNTNVTYDKIADPDSVGKSTLIIRGNNTLSPLDSKGDYTGTSKIHSFNIINVKDGSVTALEGLTTDSAAIIDATGTEVKVDGSAKLDINALEAGTTADGNTYKVISHTDKDDDAWTDSNLVYDRTAGYATGTATETGSYNITYKDLSKLTEEEKTEAVNDFVGSLGEGGENFEGAVNGIIRNGENTFAGAEKFFSEASSTGDNSGLAAMAMIGEAAGVTSNTIDVAGDMADNSVLRLSFTQDNITGEPKVNEDGAIWAKYIHNKHDLDGMDSSFGDISSSSDFDGATIGVDFAKKGKVQSGIAFSYGSGDSHGMGINNDFDMWGVSLYGNVKNDDTNVIADIGFSESDNELTGTAMGKDIKADRDVSVFTVGVRAEKLYTNGSTQIVPYTGLRYYNVDPDSYTAYYDGQKFGEYDADRQNIWTLPVGVSLRNETVTESGWRLTPKVDVAYIWAFGDTDNSFDLNTGSGVDTLDYTVMDSGSWLGSVGFEAGKDDWAFGVGYSYQKGSHEEANKWFVNVEYSF